jgi:hypothetical protein
LNSSSGTYQATRSVKQVRITQTSRNIIQKSPTEVEPSLVTAIDKERFHRHGYEARGPVVGPRAMGRAARRGFGSWKSGVPGAQAIKCTEAEELPTLAELNRTALALVELQRVPALGCRAADPIRHPLGC